MSIRTAGEMEAMREVGRIVRLCLDAMREAVRAGVTTAELDGVGGRVLHAHGARSAPALVYGFPGETCISVNDEVVHGVPSARRLEEGDLVKLDVTAEKDGFMADAAVTVGVGTLPEDRAALARCAERAFWRALREVRAGRPIRRVGRRVDAEVRRAGFSVIEALAGHGIGRTIHEAPRVPNYDDPRASQRLTAGLVITLEPIIAGGAGLAVEAGDGWTIRTLDGAHAAHYEHTLVVTEGAPLVLTAA